MSAKRNKRGGAPQDGRDLAQNRRARFEYDIVERFEAGLVLLGSEVKALRESGGTIQDAYVQVREGEAWLIGAHIPQYPPAVEPHDPTRTRKLLLHRREIEHIAQGLSQKGLSVVPLRLYFKAGRVKMELALGRGRSLYDNRRAIRDREDRREAERAMKAARR
jgi:SsrA-binding protein